ncbi:MAG: EamA family transporter [Oscillospiraceae bacterium]|nr:EamA family transporter [Oscillospiraceae bacterium]
MLDLLLAILCSTAVSLVMRLSEARIQSKTGLLAVNYLVCLIPAALYLPPAGPFPAGEGLPAALGMGCVGGFLYLAGFLLLQWNIGVNGVALSSTFMKLGVLVPTALSFLLFGEVPGAAQVLGFVLALAAILMINLEKGAGRANHRLGLILLLCIGGCTDFLSKLYEQYGDPALENHFLFYIFAVAVLLCLGVAAVQRQRIGKWEVLFGLLLGVPNYFSSRFLLRALATVPAIVAYPTCNVGVIVAVGLAGVLLFHEPLTRRRAAAMGIILAALALLNL